MNASRPPQWPVLLTEIKEAGPSTEDLLPFFLECNPLRTRCPFEEEKRCPNTSLKELEGLAIWSTRTLSNGIELFNVRPATSNSCSPVSNATFLRWVPQIGYAAAAIIAAESPEGRVEMGIPIQVRCLEEMIRPHGRVLGKLQ